MGLFNYHKIFLIFLAFLFALPLTAHEPSEEEVFRTSVQQLRNTIKEQCPMILNFTEIMEPENKYSTNDSRKDPIKLLIAKNRHQLLPHLTRAFESVKIDLNDQLVTIDEERFFYNIMEQLGSIVPYRGEPNLHIDPNTTTQPIKIANYYQSPTPSEMFDDYAISLDTPNCQVISPRDIYQIRIALLRYELNHTEIDGKNIKSPILFTPHYKDGHAFCMMHIIDINNRRVLASIFMNTSQDSNYCDMLTTRFNMLNFFYVPMSLEDYKAREEELKKKYSNSILHISPSLLCNWIVPTVDASFELQIEKDDMNCSLYTYDIINAYVKLFTERDFLLNELVELARNIDKDGIKEQLLSILTSSVKQYLNQYYDSTGTRKSMREIKQYHMKLRWDLSSNWLKKTLDGWCAKTE